MICWYLLAQSEQFNLKDFKHDSSSMILIFINIDIISITKWEGNIKIKTSSDLIPKDIDKI